MTINNRSEIDSIKDKLDIVDVVGQTVDLLDTGGGIYKGAISSGSKSGKSLHVNQNMQVYNDFAGKTGGDVLEWIAYNNHLDAKADFPAVLKIAAELAGIELKKQDNYSIDDSHNYDLSILMTAIAEYYHSCLSTEHREFITATWGISNEIIDQLHIGFASRGNQLIKKFNDVFQEDMIFETGLVLKFTDKHKDLFQGRIIFPYWKNGKVLYFIGRHTKWTPDNKFERDSKYIKQSVHNENHPYVSEYISNQYFYGEDTIRGADSVLITEGVTDCIMAMQTGIPCISPVTINIKKTELERAYTLIKNASSVYICNDNDSNEAGKDGAITTADFLSSKGINVRLVELPLNNGETKTDLAEYLRDFSIDEYKLLEKKAKTLYRVRLESNIVDQDPAIAIEGAIKFIKTELKDQSKAYINTFIETHLKDHFTLTSSQVRDIKSTISKNGKNGNKFKKVPLTKDKIKIDAELNIEINVPVPYCLKTVYGEVGTFKHSIIIDAESGTDKDVYDIICYNPTWLKNSFVDPLTKFHYLELCYEYRGGVIAQIVSQKDILTTAGLKGLTATGLNVPESKTKALADYFATYISKSKTLTEREIYSRFGWSINNSIFVIGTHAVSIDNKKTAHLTKDILAETAQALEPIGTPAGWIDATKGLLQYDNVRFICYAAATALILKVLGGASFVVEQVADTSKGKTITAQLAMSMFGNPEKLKMATSATKIFIERTCATCNDLPIFLDETSMMQPEILTETVYMITNERGRGRAKKDGGVEKIDTWKSVMLTTGETPLTNSASLGGQDVRIISIYNGIGAFDPENVEYYKDRMEDNYGQIAPLIIQKILSEGDNLKIQYEMVRSKLKEFSKDDKTGVMGRAVDTYALIAMAGFIFEDVLNDIGEDPKDAGTLIEKMFCDKLTQSDGSLPDRAFTIVYDWIMENKKNFCENKVGAAGDRYDLYGNISMEWPDEEVPYDYIDIIPQKLKEIIDKKLKHPGISKRVLRDWGESGRIELSTDGRVAILSTLKVGTKAMRVVRLKIPLNMEVN